MRKGLKVIAIPLAAFIAGAMSPAPAMDNDVARVSRIVQRSKTTTATYALYIWNRIKLPGREPIEEWSAEFNSGDLHRVETPRDRVVADCRAKTGAALSLITGKVTRGPEVAASACGIDTEKKFLRLEMFGRFLTSFGNADRVRIVDLDNIRTYDISDDGIILRTTYQESTEDHPVVLEAEAAGLARELPATDMFSELSLGSSLVPDSFKIAPKSAVKK